MDFCTLHIALCLSISIQTSLSIFLSFETCTHMKQNKKQTANSKQNLIQLFQQFYQYGIVCDFKQHLLQHKKKK